MNSADSPGLLLVLAIM